MQWRMALAHFQPDIGKIILKMIEDQFKIIA
jgi:hypothetical protein